MSTHYHPLTGVVSFTVGNSPLNVPPLSAEAKLRMQQGEIYEGLQYDLAVVDSSTPAFATLPGLLVDDAHNEPLAVGTRQRLTNDLGERQRQDYRGECCVKSAKMTLPDGRLRVCLNKETNGAIQRTIDSTPNR